MMPRFSKTALWAGISLGALITTQPATAQTINYGSLEELFGEPVTTSATGKPQRVTEVPVTMEIITAEDIRRSGATDIPTLLRSVAGIDVLDFSSTQRDVGFRGYNQPYNPRLLVLINGRQVYVDIFGWTQWSILPVQLSEIRQIEIVKGPNTALFGFNAVSGVINIVTYSPLYDDANEVEALAGTHDTFGGSVVSTIRPSEKAGIRFSAGFHRDEIEDFSQLDPVNRAFVEEPKTYKASIDSLFQIGPKTQAGIEGTFSTSRETNVQPQFAIAGTDYDTYSIKGSLISDTSLGLARLTIYSNWVLFESESAGAHADLDNNTTVVQIEDLFKIGTRHTFRLSAEYRHNGLDQTTELPGDAPFSDTLGYSVISAGGMWDWLITNSLSFSTSFRIDHLNLGRNGPEVPGLPFGEADFDSRKITEWSFNSGLVFRASAEDTIRLMAARGVQMPSLVMFGLKAVSFNRPFPAAFVGTPFIRPSIVWNYELGYDHNFSQLGTRLRTAIFFQRNTDVPSFLPAGPTGISLVPPLAFATTANIGNSEVWGFEIALKGHVADGWYWEANYTYTDVNDKLANRMGGALFFPVEFEDANASSHANAKLGYDKGRWSGEISANYTSKRQIPFALPSAFGQRAFDDLLLVNARIGYRITEHAELSIESTGLNQATYRSADAIGIKRVFRARLRFAF